MDIRELGRLDLNLLVALEALLEERNVSRAAERLFITQSAMSKTLARLRELFGDPLFIRRSSGMVPTPRAEQLAAHLPQVLQAVQVMVQPAEFDPLAFEGKFRLLVEGHMGVWVLPMLMQRLHDTAPRLQLRTLSTADDALDRLAQGSLDFVLQGERQTYPPEYRLCTLGYAPPRLLARKGHPLEGRELTWELLEPYLKVQLLIPELMDIQFHAPDSTFVPRVAQVQPLLRTDHLPTALRVVLESDYVLPAPPLFMDRDDLARDLVSLPAPTGEDLAISYVMVSHERIEHSPAHAFLRGEMLTVIEDFRRAAGLPSLGDLRVQRGLAY